MRKYHALIALFVFAFFFGGFLLCTGTINSGVHFQDDHEMTSIHAKLESTNYNVPAVFISQMDTEINVIRRFRPFYYLHRIVEVGLLQNNILAMSIYNGVLIVATALILYLLGCWLRVQLYRVISSSHDGVSRRAIRKSFGCWARLKRSVYSPIQCLYSS